MLYSAFHSLGGKKLNELELNLKKRNLTLQLQDTTSRQLADRIRAVSRLAGNVSHELNNLLTIIIPLSSSLTQRLKGEELEDTQDILEASLRVNL